MTRKTFRRAPGDERRHDLIRATLDCIADSGMHAVTVRAVAQRAGVSNGLIRHYFDSKDRMVQEAYRATMDEMTTLVKAASTVAGAPARERLRRFVAANLGAPVADIRRLTLWASFIGMVHVDPAMAAIHREHYLAFRRELEALLGEVLAEAGRPARAPARRRAAIKINATIDGLWLEGTLAPEMFAKRELVAMGIEAVEAILGLKLRATGKEA